MSGDQWGEYLRAKEPGVREKAYAWKTAIGLQKVDGLTPTEYLVETARRNIEGEITLAESRQLVSDYHKAKKRAGGDSADRSAEAEIVRHIARFTSNLWQIHAFGEGNTRTTGVFVIKYLLTLGFDVANDVFAENAWYFRNALVRANYTNVPKGIEETTEYLELFFRNLLLGESNVLQSRYLIVGGWKGPDAPTSNPTSNVATPTSNAATPTSKNSGNWALSEAVRRLLLVLGEEELTRGKLMKALKLKDRKNFSEYSLGPALKIGLVEMTQPDSPRSPTQRYRLTAWGQKVKAQKV